MQVHETEGMNTPERKGWVRCASAFLDPTAVQISAWEERGLVGLERCEKTTTWALALA